MPDSPPSFRQQRTTQNVVSCVGSGQVSGSSWELIYTVPVGDLIEINEILWQNADNTSGIFYVWVGPEGAPTTPSPIENQPEVKIRKAFSAAESAPISLKMAVPPGWSIYLYATAAVNYHISGVVVTN